MLTAGDTNIAKIEAGAGSTMGGLNAAGAGTDIVFWAGATHANRATAPFRVKANGDLYASNADLTGTITATVGAIGGWTINTANLAATNITLYSGAANTARIEIGASTYIAGINSPAANGDIAFWAGATHTNRASAPFRVTGAGAVTATAGVIGGWTLSSTALTAGSGANTVGLDAGGTNPAIYAGAATPASAPFRVTNTGIFTATEGNIIGNLSIGTGGKVYSGSSANWQSDGYQLEYNSGDPRLYIGDGGVTASDKYLMWDGSTLSWRAANTFLDTSGNLTASSATLSGAITATSGSITGAFTVGAQLSIGTSGTLVSGGATWQSDGYQLEYNAGNPRLYIGDGGVTASDKYLLWDGTTISWRAANTFLDTSGNLTASSATLPGAITATSGSITGNLSIGTGGKLYSGAAATWQSDGYQLEYNAGDPRLYIGDGGVSTSDKYLMWDGANLEWRGANTSLTAAGLFTATNAVITGAITATTGNIGGWDITASAIETSPLSQPIMRLAPGNATPYIALGSPLPPSPFANNGIWFGMEAGNHQSGRQSIL